MITQQADQVSAHVESLGPDAVAALLPEGAPAMIGPVRVDFPADAIRLAKDGPHVAFRGYAFLVDDEGFRRNAFVTGRIDEDEGVGILVAPIRVMGA